MLIALAYIVRHVVESRPATEIGKNAFNSAFLRHEVIREAPKSEVASFLCSPISRLTFLQGFHNNLTHVSAPLFKRNPAFVKKFVALVDSRNA